MTKIEMTEAIIAAKITKGTSWAAIAEAGGLSEIFVTSACLGQNSLELDVAVKVTDFLGLDEKVAYALTICPMKAVDVETVSKDPLIYRFFEIAYVYGGSMKEIIHEKFGDGIMSAIDFKLDIDKEEDPKGDRVVVTMNGKFLPYKKW
ncbi:cyanase [Rubellicoccus peritrichatus]|uniref:Cyanate hydratase n=2 Tax=Rubellicoccus peritrichatus TaxID=3080537 RepID=A0AAQ3QU95_9BACT|nr:cyanase [Puniceicoccus sp. CR14]WOO40233.1 cyanase [Puniceicoccus sp. CR14]